MIRTQISLDPDLYEEAREEARRQGVSFAELVRRALAATLPSRASEHPWSRYRGVIESGDKDASSTVDAVVYGRERP